MATYDGYVADKGQPYGERTNGLSYGWSAEREGVIRNVDPEVQYDTHIRVDEGNWRVSLPDGTYPVVVVMGDPVSERAHSKGGELAFP